MQTIILAGGFGSRLSEETRSQPKPMVTIGGRPIISHIMDGYSAHGYDDFIVACGYRADVIKHYFHNLHVHTNDWVFDIGAGTQSAINSTSPQWRMTVVDTGLNTMTGGRVRRLREYTGGGTFMVTYGDGVGNVDIGQLVAFHKQHGKLATVTAVRPPARFGCLSLEDDQVACFEEKPQSEAGWINGGFFVFEDKVFDYLSDDQTVLEQDPLAQLAAHGELMAWRHHGFWQPMDTLRDKNKLESLWESGNPPWCVTPANQTLHAA